MTQTPEEKAIAEYSVHLEYIRKRLDDIDEKLDKRISGTDLDLAINGAIGGHVKEMHNCKKDSVPPRPRGGGFVGSMNAAQKTTFFSLILALLSAATIAIQSKVSGNTVQPVPQTAPASIEE